MRFDRDEEDLTAYLRMLRQRAVAAAGHHSMVVLTCLSCFGDDEALVPAVDNAIDSSVLARAETHNLAGSINTTLGERESNQVRASFGRTHLDFGPVDGSPLVFNSLLGTTGPIGRLVLAPYSPVGVYQGKGNGAEMTGAEELQENLLGREHRILERTDLPFLDRYFQVAS